MCDSQRRAIVKLLRSSCGVKRSVAKSYENQIYSIATAQSLSDDVDTVYSTIAYDCIGRIVQHPAQIDLIVEEMTQSTSYYDSSLCNLEREEEYRKTSQKSKGITVEEGEYKCKKKGCTSNRCYIYQLQLRSADEPMTVFVVCTKCCSTYRKDD